MKRLFCKWLSALLIAALLLTGMALAEESVESELFEVAPAEETFVTFGDDAAEIGTEAVEEALPEIVTEAAADAVIGESAVEEPEVVEAQTDEAAKLMEADGAIPVDEAHFPDPAFRQYVFNLTGGTGVLSQQSREGVEAMGGNTQKYTNGGGFYTIDGPTGKVKWSLGVTSLQGIEYFPNLVSIDCSYNPIVSLDVSMLDKLMVLRCEQCGMTSLNVSGCTNLFYLRIQKNELTSLDLTNCQYFAEFPIGFKNEKSSFKDVKAYSKKFAAPVSTPQHVKNETNNAKEVVLLCDTKLTINGAASSATQTDTAASVPAAFTEVEGATNAAVTVAPGATVSKTTAAVVAAPGSKTQLDFGGASAKKLKSSNKKFATVNSAGVVTFKKAGKVKITYKVGKQTRTVVLKVTDPTIPTGVTIDPVATDVKKGDTVTLNATLSEGGVSGIKWKTSNKKVATVKDGVVTFKKAGKVTVTAITTRGKKKATVTFNVSK